MVEKTVKLLPEAEDNLKKLREIADASAARLLELGKQWENHRGPLLTKYRRKKQEINDRKSEVRTKLEQIKRMRQEMKDMAVDIKEKDVLHKQVIEDFNKLPKSINRQVYVRRIMDIMKNLGKQKADIRKVRSVIFYFI